jgi:hypothetical protein
MQWLTATYGKDRVSLKKEHIMMVMREPFIKAFTCERNRRGAARSGLVPFTECLLYHEDVLPTRPDTSVSSPGATASTGPPTASPAGTAAARAPETPDAGTITHDVIEGLKELLFGTTGEKTAELKAIEEATARAATRGRAITTRRYCFTQVLTDEDTIAELGAAAKASEKKCDAEDKTADDNAKDAASATTLEE